MRFRDELIECFNNTQAMYQSDDDLRDVADWSREHTELVPADSPLELPPAPAGGGSVTVTKHRTFEAAQLLIRQYPGKRVAVLNFASPVNPGGGVTVGSGAQEECLCRCSTLYPCLDQRALWDGYYVPNRAAHNQLATDACIYSPRVKVFKSDERLPVPLPRESWYDVDVITCAAPNMYRIKRRVTDDTLRQIHISRARRILSVAVSRHVDVLVLGAFGCGAFENDPRVVASAWRHVTEELGAWFDALEYAVWCPPHDLSNYDAFAAEFSQLA